MVTVLFSSSLFTLALPSVDPVVALLHEFRTIARPFTAVTVTLHVVTTIAEILILA